MAPEAPIIHLAHRATLAVSGADRVPFLEGLVSNAVAEATGEAAIWAALLTPQGKYLADFFILADADRLLLDIEAAQAEDLARRLSRFRLRARVEIAPASLAVYAGWGAPPPAGLGFADPRLPDAGWRLLAPPGLAAPDLPAWDAHRLPIGLPDGTRDLEPNRTVLLEAGFDALHGVSWTKGCYMGQELTARTRYRGLIKRRLVPVFAAAGAPPPGTPVLADDREVGELRSGSGPWALAVLRLDALDQPLHAGGTPLAVRRPLWWPADAPAAPAPAAPYSVS